MCVCFAFVILIRLFTSNIIMKQLFYFYVHACVLICHYFVKTIILRPFDLAWKNRAAKKWRVEQTQEVTRDIVTAPGSFVGKQISSLWAAERGIQF